MAQVSSYRRCKPNGGHTTVREHDRRGVGGAGVLAGAAVVALVLGVSPAVLAAGVVVVFPLWAAHRFPDEARGLRVAVGRARERSGPLLRRARQSAVAHVRARLARRNRDHQFQRGELRLFDHLGEHPEMAALLLEELDDGGEPDGVLAYTQQAAAAVCRSGRKRELAGRVRNIRRQCRHLSMRLDIEAAYAQKLWRASPTDWFSGEIGRARHRRGKQMTKLDKLARAAEMKALGQLAEGHVPQEVSDTLQSIFDALFERSRHGAPNASSGATGSRRESRADGAPRWTPAHVQARAVIRRT